MHLGFIMDGNGRWAKQRLLPRSQGHLAGFEAAKRVVAAGIKLGVDYMTFYAFSTENWKRPVSEVSFLMKAIETKIPECKDTFIKNGVKVLHRGNLDALPEASRDAVIKLEEDTHNCNVITVVLCINYGGQDEIVRAVNRFIDNNKGSHITEELLRKNLDAPSVPFPDMIARSAGEKRLSNFMLWDSAYAELISLEKYWPEWGEEEVRFCLEELSKRTRKFGGLTDDKI